MHPPCRLLECCKAICEDATAAGGVRAKTLSVCARVRACVTEGNAFLGIASVPCLLLFVLLHRMLCEPRFACVSV